MKKYSVAIIGGGSAGLTAARLAAKFGVSVVLFEKHHIGGDCLHTGCVPSKGLISVARAVFEAQRLNSFGLNTSFKLNYGEIKKHYNESIQHIYKTEDNEKILEELGVDVVAEKVSFINENELKSESGETYKFKKAIIASGSSPSKIAIEGLPDERIITSDTIWQLERIPRHLLVIGAGPIGLELGQAFSMLGSKVTVLERSHELLGRFDNDVAEAVKAGLKQSGVKVLYDSEITDVKDETELKLRISSNGNSEMYTADKVLVAIGRTPNISGFGLEELGIDADEISGISVDKNFRTTKKNIYAVGDCIGAPYFTHLAGEQGANALIHALFARKRPVNWEALPWAFFTTPEISHVGASEKHLQLKNAEYETELIDFDSIDKAIAEHNKGNVKILLDKKRRILGATIIGRNASELIGYYAYLMANHEKLDKLAKPIQAYPTYTVALRQHAGNVQLKSITNSFLTKLVLKLRGY